MLLRIKSLVRRTAFKIIKPLLKEYLVEMQNQLNISKAIQDNLNISKAIQDNPNISSKLLSIGGLAPDFIVPLEGNSKTVIKQYFKCPARGVMGRLC
jgi:hypothetical protein